MTTTTSWEPVRTPRAIEPSALTTWSASLHSLRSPSWRKGTR